MGPLHYEFKQYHQGTGRLIGKRLAGKGTIKITEQEYCTHTGGAHHPQSDSEEYPNILFTD